MNSPAPVKLVCLDGYTLNPGDMDWGLFEQLASFTVHDRTPTDQIVARAGDAEAVLTNKVPFDAPTIAALPKLRYIGVLATGYNIVDIEAARQRNITVTNVPAYSTESVAQHTVALILELARGIGTHNAAVQHGDWAASEDFCFTRTPIVELTGRTLALLGLGRIGLAVARIAASMGMRLAAFSRNPARADTQGLDISFLPLDELFAQADVLSLHCPLTEATHHIVDARRIGLMKPHALIINTARGPLIDEQALAHALREKLIGGAGLDVLSNEPPAANHPLIGLPNCIVTPHIAWCAVEARQRLMGIAADNLRAFLAGTPTNVVN